MRQGTGIRVYALYLCCCVVAIVSKVDQRSHANRDTGTSVDHSLFYYKELYFKSFVSAFFGNT
jgi:hypothetical protein